MELQYLTAVSSLFHIALFARIYVTLRVNTLRVNTAILRSIITMLHCAFVMNEVTHDDCERL